jgi:hypothetical protein
MGRSIDQRLETKLAFQPPTQILHNEWANLKTTSPIVELSKVIFLLRWNLSCINKICMLANLKTLQFWNEWHSSTFDMLKASTLRFKNTSEENALKSPYFGKSKNKLKSDEHQSTWQTARQVETWTQYGSNEAQCMHAKHSFQNTLKTCDIFSWYFRNMTSRNPQNDHNPRDWSTGQNKRGMRQHSSA